MSAFHVLCLITVFCGIASILLPLIVCIWENIQYYRILKKLEDDD